MEEKIVDEMFEELGYKSYIDKQGNIVYKNAYKGMIVFDIKYKQIICTSEYNQAYPFNMQELQAISKKVEELGWV